MAAEEALRLVKELHAPCIETTTNTHDCKIILQRSREEYFPGMQQQILDLNKKVDALTEVLRGPDQKTQERPPLPCASSGQAGTGGRRPTTHALGLIIVRWVLY